MQLGSSRLREFALIVLFCSMLLVACTSGVRSEEIVTSNFELTSSTTNAAVGDFVTLTLGMDYGLVGPAPAKNFTVKLGICTIDMTTGTCPINPEENGAVNLPATLELAPDSEWAVFTELTADKGKRFEHSLRLTALEPGVYRFRGFMVFYKDGEWIAYDDPADHLSFEEVVLTFE